MFISKDGLIAHSQTIRGVRYITASYYGGTKDVFQKLKSLILTSSNPVKNAEDSLVGSDIALDED